MTRTVHSNSNLEIWTPRTPTPFSCHFRRSRLVTGVVMALPFVFCFSLFGVCNLVAGTIVTILACKPRFGVYLNQNHSNELDTNQKMTNFVDPLKIVGPILLVTGATLVIIGIILGVIACRSVYEKRNLAKLSSANIVAVQNMTGSLVELSPMNTTQSPVSKRKDNFSTTNQTTEQEFIDDLAGASLQPEDDWAITSFTNSLSTHHFVDVEANKSQYENGNLNLDSISDKQDQNYLSLELETKCKLAAIYGDIECIVSRNEIF